MQDLASAKKSPLYPLSPHQDAIYLLYCRSYPPVSRVFNSVIREICSYLVPELIAFCPSEKHLYLFNVRDERWLSMKYPINSQLCRYSGYLYLGCGKIFACGGRYAGNKRACEASNFAYVLSIQGELQSLPSMKVGREEPGLVAFAHSIFVFGGFRETLLLKDERFRSSESFNLIEEEWSDLPDMKWGRSGFCACVWRGEIYLCGGGSPVIEAYNPLESTIREVPTTVSAPAASVIFAKDEELVALSSRLVVKFRYEGEVLKAKTEEMSIFPFLLRQSPVVLGGHVYATQWSTCIAFDLLTLKTGKVYAIPQTNRQ